MPLPVLDKCCGCITDLKTASAIIAVLGIVTSPALSWAVVRHSYVIRVSCFISSSSSRPDVMDITLNHVLSFGFGAHAGLGPSCLGPSKPNNKTLRLAESDDPRQSPFVNVTRLFGWVVLCADVLFIGFSIYYLIRIFKGLTKRAIKMFMVSAIIALILSFIYALLYVIICLTLGGGFPVIEMFFALFDVGLWIVWCYFICVLNSFYVKFSRPPPPPTLWERVVATVSSFIPICVKEKLSTTT